MNVAEQLIKAIWKESCAGWRDLAGNEFRISQVGKSSRCLKLDKKYNTKPDPEKPEFTTKDGIIHVSGSEAVAGTILHRWIQEILSKHPDFLHAEREMKFSYGDVKFSGHVDLDVKDEDNEAILYDIKTVSTNIFPYVTLQKTAGPRTYSMLKREENYHQVNHYAHFTGYKRFYIIWMNRDTMAFKIEGYITSRDDAIKTCERLERGLAMDIANTKVSDGVALCDCGSDKKAYCDHHDNGICPGYDKLVHDEQFEKLGEKKPKIGFLP